MSHIVVSQRKLTEEESAQAPTEPVTTKTAVTGQDYFYSIKDDNFAVKIVKLDITKDIPADEYVKSEIEKYYKDLDQEYQVVNCELEAEIDTAFSKVRTEENPFGNFLCDLMRFHHNSDCAILNSGNIRADRVFSKGPMKIVDWDDLIPFVVPILKISCTGKVLK